MDIIHSSYIYAILRAIGTWFSRQWEQSILFGWLTGQRSDHSSGSLGQRLGEKIRSSYCGIFEKLRLDRLFQGSIFLHPEWFAAAAVILAPLVPTLVILALVCASFFSLLLKLGIDRQRKLESSPLNGYVLLFAMIYGYSTLTSVNFSGSLFSGLLTCAFVLFFFCITSCNLSRKGIEGILYGMMAAGVAVSLYGFYQFLFPHKFENIWTDTDMFSSIAFRVYSTLENPNVLGEYFLMTLPVCCATVLNAKDRSKRMACIAAVVIMAGCLVMTYSRGSYLGILFAAIVFLALLDRRFLIVGLVALALSPLYLPESVLSRFTSIGNTTDTSTSYRINIWLASLAMLKDYWLCGLGPGMEAFNTVYPEYAYYGFVALHAHSLYLQLICDCGISGIVVFVILIVSFYRMMFTAIRRETDRSAKVYQIAGTATITGFLVQSAVDFTFYNYKITLLFWTMLGLCVLFTKMGKPQLPETCREAEHE